MNVHHLVCQFVVERKFGLKNPVGDVVVVLRDL